MRKSTILVMLAALFLLSVPGGRSAGEDTRSFKIENPSCTDAYTYRAKVVRWIDGDTVELEVDLGFKLKYSPTFRLLYVNTPERNKPGFQEAKKYSENYAPVGSTVVIQVKKRSDKYGRPLCLLWDPKQSKTLNELLIEKNWKY